MFDFLGCCVSFLNAARFSWMLFDFDGYNFIFLDAVRFSCLIFSSSMFLCHQF